VDLMGRKITGMTEMYGDRAETVNKKMMVRYANEDWNDDIVGYLDETIKQLRLGGLEKNRYAIHTLDYWKYLFMMARNEKEAAMHYLMESYEKNGPDAIAQYAYFYYTGQGVTNIVNRSKAKRLFASALSEPSMFAEYLYAEAIMYKSWDNIEVVEMAMPYYSKALKKGVLFARYKLANCYLKTGRNLDEAVKLFEKCEERDAPFKAKEAMALIKGKNKR
jgi:TPR repeat protein